MIAIYVFVSVALQTFMRMEHIVELGIVARNIIATLVFLFCPVITLIIWCKIRKYGSLKDEFFFFFELKMVALLWIFSLFLPVVLALLDWGLAATSCVIPYSFFFAVMSPSLMSTVVIPLKIKKKTKQHDAAEEVNNVIDLEECTAYKVVDMLKDEALCEALVTWMMREFSVENVLSFMEIVHFKRHVKKIKDNQATIAAEEATDTANVTAAVEEVQVKYIDYYC